MLQHSNVPSADLPIPAQFSLNLLIQLNPLQGGTIRNAERACGGTIRGPKND
jgi:hypothetical protein